VAALFGLVSTARPRARFDHRGRQLHRYRLRVHAFSPKSAGRRCHRDRRSSASEGSALGIWTRRQIGSGEQRECDGEPRLKQQLGRTSLMMIGIASIVGAGIFVLTGTAAAQYAGPGVVISLVDGEPIARVATDLLISIGLINDMGTIPSTATAPATGFVSFMRARSGETWRLTARHLQLVVLALTAAVLIAVPLGLVLERAPLGAEWVVGALGVLQTIPSIALLAFMIPLFGVGLTPALVALWLYALYPIARNTYSGVRSADPEAVEACEAMGATPVQRLLWVRLPLAAPLIVAGVRTAAVITVGAATLAAFIGAGGLGEPIVTGLALADSRLILSGALPAALLALVADALLGLVERLLTPEGVRLAERRGA
jgi:ABC-type proline/glycine betaine transport system permease subunit